jgi:ATP-binding cassette subfamily B protein
MTLFSILRRELWAFRRRLLAILILGLLAMPIALAVPLPLKIIVDNVLGHQPLSGVLAALLPDAVTGTRTGVLVFALFLLLAVTVLGLFQSQSLWLLSESTGEKMVLRLRSQMFEHVQRLSLAYHDKDGLTDATYRIQYDAPAIHQLIVWGVVPLVSAIATFFGMLYVIIRASVPLSMVALGISPIVIFLTLTGSRRLGPQWERVKQLEISALGVVQEVLGAIRVVSAFSQERRELDRFVSSSARGVHERLGVMSRESTIAVLIGLTFGIGTMLVLFLGVREVDGGTLTLGSLLLVISYLGQLYGPLQMVGKQIVAQQGTLVSVRRAFELLGQEPAVVQRKDAREIDRVAGAVSFRNVGFSYPDGHRVLDHAAFDIPAGTRVAITGPTGSGKTTLMSLLTRFYDPQEGEILIDGVDLRDYRLADLRRQFAIVLQEPVLFSTSIAANIAYAQPDATFEQIVAAARAANAHDFISRLPQGYETSVGGRGAKLSGGERQRIALARAFLKNAPILIMDEPTSSVDTVTEAAILAAMETLMEGRTAFLITHRLYAIARCDMHIVVREGHVNSAPVDTVVPNPRPMLA